MFNSLTLSYFRSHKQTKLEFVPGINVIQGESRSGKSNIFRAMYWVMENRPLGGRVRSRFMGDKDETSVVLELTEGVTVTTTDDGKMSYMLEGLGTKEEFKVINKDVPDVVKKALNLTSTNVQEQLDPHFLITSTAGEVARAMNRITHIENVDEWVSELTSKINEENKIVKAKKEELKVSKEKLGKYDKLEAYEREVSELERMESREKLLDGQWVRLNQSIVELESCATRMNGIGSWLECEDLVSEIEADLKALERLDEELKLFEQYDQLQATIEEEQKFLGFMVPIVTAINVQIGALNALENDYSSLAASISDYESAVTTYTESERARNEGIAKFAEYVRGLGACPWCGTKVSEKVVDHIIKEL